MAKLDWQTSSFLHKHVEHFEEHSKRVASVVDEARNRFNDDYTGYSAAFSAAILTASLVGGFFGINQGIAITGMVIGGFGILGSLLCHHLNQRQQITFTREVIDLEQERTRAAQRAATIKEFWLHGIPDGTPLAQIQVILGDTPTTVHNDGEPMRWKALPKPNLSDDETDNEA
ncbi:hypothetical protein [Gimesia maris]|uniref:SLATT domain-containing protein n=2 Tax=Gimesia maris TaxID=122 RepID=A0ABX5YHZ3_9PLAN|nr:hypothetical protein [Gimesia maris]QEG15220.1 hypothetical protein GmarT_10590 [Gimesia maris]QGQ31441.1 hypothetical protein F1729_23960 [Gimesia maris]